jgi:hypothetical protein
MFDLTPRIPRLERSGTQGIGAVDAGHSLSQITPNAKATAAIDEQ